MVPNSDLLKRKAIYTFLMVIFLARPGHLRQAQNLLAPSPPASRGGARADDETHHWRFALRGRSGFHPKVGSASPR